MKKKTKIKRIDRDGGQIEGQEGGGGNGSSCAPMEDLVTPFQRS